MLKNEDFYHDASLQSCQPTSESAIRKLNSTVVQQKTCILQTQHWSTGCCDSPSMIEAIQNWDAQVIAYGPASGTVDCRNALPPIMVNGNQNSLLTMSLLLPVVQRLALCFHCDL